MNRPDLPATAAFFSRSSLRRLLPFCTVLATIFATAGSALAINVTCPRGGYVDVPVGQLTSNLIYLESLPNMAAGDRIARVSGGSVFYNGDANFKVPDPDYTSNRIYDSETFRFVNNADGSASGTIISITYRTGYPPGNGGGTITIRIADPLPPTITQHPANQTVVAGNSVTFTAQATGVPSPGVQWQVSSDGGANWSNFGSNSNTLTFTTSANDNGKRYRAVYSNYVNNSVPTNAATLTVNSPPAFTSANAASLRQETNGSFTITTSGIPTGANMVIGSTGTLPAGVTFTDNRDGTARLSGTAAAGTQGVYPLVFTASNGIGAGATQNFTLSITEPLGLEVTTDDDTVDPTDGKISLREAIANAATLGGEQTITFSNNTADGAVNFYDGTEHKILLSAGQLAVLSHLNIVGPGAGFLTVDANNASRIMSVSDQTISLSGMTLANGSALGGGEAGDGAGLFAPRSDLTIADCAFTENFSFGIGGAVCQYDAPARLMRVSFFRNGAGRSGGAAYLGHEAVTIEDCSFSENRSRDGAALFLLGDDAVISGSAFVNNSATAFGGALSLQGSTARLLNCTFSGNAAAKGGCLGLSGFLSPTSIAMYNCTLVENSSLSETSIFCENHGITPTIEAHNSIFVESFGSNIGVEGSTTVISGGYNLSSDDFEGFLNQPTDRTDTDPLLAPLADNGGLTLTHAPLPGSPAIDGGDPDFDPDAFTPPLTTDQRGEEFARVVHGIVDIGAYEEESPPSFLNTSLAGNDLVIEEEGGDTADNLEIGFDGTNYLVRVVAGNLVFRTNIPNVVGDRTRELTIPASLFSGDIIVNGQGGNDTLTVDFDGSKPINNIVFNGGTQSGVPGDSLVVTGGSITDAVFDYASESDGAVTLDGLQIAYTGLEPITSTVTATNVTLNYSDAGETISVSDAGSGQTTVDSTVGEITTFNHPTGTLTINGGQTGDDTITIASLAASYPASVVINGGGVSGTDTVIIDSSLDLGADSSLTVDSDQIEISGSQLSTVNGYMRFTGSTTIKVPAYSALSVVTSGGDVTFDGAVTGHQVDLLIDTSVVGNFAGGNVSLGAFTGTGDSFLNDLTVTTSGGPSHGSLTLHDTILLDAILADTAEFVMTSPGDIIISSTLTVDTAAGGGEWGGDVNWSTSNVYADEPGLELNIDTTARALFHGDIFIGLVDDNDGSASFLESLTIDAVSVNSAIVTLNGDIFVDDDGSGAASTGVTIEGQVRLPASRTIDTAANGGEPGGPVRLAVEKNNPGIFNGTSDARVTATANDVDLTIDTRAADGTTAGNVSLRAFDNTGGFVVRNVTVDATGTDGGEIALTGPVQLDPTSGALALNTASQVTSPAGLPASDIVVAGKMTIDGDLSPGGSIGKLPVTSDVVLSAGDTLTIEIDGTAGPGNIGGHDQLSVTSGDVTLGGATLAIEASTMVGAGSVFTIVEGSGNISGTFAGLADGDTLSAGGSIYRINYGAQAVTLTTIIANFTAAEGDAAVDLFAATGETPGTGTFSGNGVTNNIFDPSTAVGVNTITFTPTDGSPVSFTLTVSETPGLEVTTIDDVVDDTDDQTSLREAIAYAATLGGAQTIIFSDTTANGAVDFHDGTARTITLNGTQLEISSSISISGPGADLLVVDANNLSRVFRIHSGHTVAISDMTMTRGYAGYVAGGILGGAIFSSSELRLVNCAVTDSLAEIVGGGIYLEYADGEFIGSTFTANTAGAQGGAINYQANGNSRLRVINSTLHGNRANGKGEGGAICHVGTSSEVQLEIVNSTIVGNTAEIGPGPSVCGGISSTNRGTVTLVNSIVANNTLPNLLENGGTFSSLGYNLCSDDGSGFLDHPTDQINTDPLLGPLADNGGPTLTHALLPGSPAIDAGDPTFDPEEFDPALMSDQRGQLRVAKGLLTSAAPAVDIGAFELNLPTLEFTAAFSGPTTATGTTTLTYTITNTGTLPATGLVFTHNLDDMLPGLVASDTPLADPCGAGSSLTGTSLLSFSGGTLEASESCRFSVTVKIPASAAAGDYAGSTSVLFQEGYPVALGASTSLSIEPPPIFTTKFAPDTIVDSGVTTLVFTIDNTASTLEATDLDFTDNLPAGLVVASPPNIANSFGGTVTATSGTGTITLTGGTVAPGASGTLSVDLTSSTPGNHVNTTGDLTSSSGNSGTATDTLTVNAAADLTITITRDPDPVRAGGTLTYTVTVTNNGPSTAENVIVTTAVPTGTRLIATVGTAEDPVGIPAASLGSIPAGESVQFTIEVLVDRNQFFPFDLTATVTSSTRDRSGSVISENTSLEVLAQIFQPDLRYGEKADPLSQKGDGVFGAGQKYRDKTTGKSVQVFLSVENDGNVEDQIVSGIRGFSRRDFKIKITRASGENVGAAILAGREIVSLAPAAICGYRVKIQSRDARSNQKFKGIFATSSAADPSATDEVQLQIKFKKRRIARPEIAKPTAL